MQDHIEAYCHVGLVHPAAFPEAVPGEGLVLETLTKIIEDDYFGAVEIGKIKDAGIRRQARQLLESARMDIIYAGSGQCFAGHASLSSPDSAMRAQALAAGKECIDYAYEMGAQIMTLASGGDPGEAQREEATRCLIDSLQQLCDYAQEQGESYILALSLENFDRDIARKQLIGPTREAAAIAQAVKEHYSNFGLTLDLAHQPLLGESIPDMLIDGTDDIIHAHLGNCVLQDGHPLYGDFHPRFDIAGGENGVEEVRTFLESLVYIGYFKKTLPTRMPVISLAVKPAEGETSGAVIASAKRVLREAWAKLGSEIWA
ncbi:MAG: TIM barrel protein [Armatimonadetes bacterium]|nr:TIM barrel protein [Armatimonadota bacterium]